jgi:hypothetical protein
MAGLFTKALEKKGSEKRAAKPKKSTLWMAGATDQGKAVADALHHLTELDAQRKAIEAKMGIHKSIVSKFANENFVRDYADTSVFPETPMVVQNGDGEKVTFVVQDRSGQSAVKDEQKEALTQILGEDRALDLLVEETTFSFTREVLLKEGVMPILEKHLEAAIKDLTKKGLISEDEQLLDVEQAAHFRPGTIERLGLICGKDSVKMREVIEAMGSACVRYIKC